MAYGIPCQYPTACRCTHTECDAGWLEEEAVHVKHQVTYSAAIRCPVCADAIPAPKAPRRRRGDQ